MKYVNKGGDYKTISGRGAFALNKMIQNKKSTIDNQKAKNKAKKESGK